MSDEILTKLDELLVIIKNNKKIIEMKSLRKKLLNDKELMDKIKKYQNDSVTNHNLKLEIYDNKDYKRYQLLETEIYFLTLSINQKLNKLVDKKRCHR